MPEPPIDEVLQGGGVEVVERVAALVASADQARRHEQLDVLGDGLARHAELVLGRQARTQLEQGLPVALSELVEDGAAGRVGQRFEDVAHARPTAPMIGKPLLACQ